MNYATLAGHLGADPETRFTPQGQKVTTLRIGCRARKNETIWWRVTIWGDHLDRMLQHFKKGSSIVVFGDISKPEIFTDREGKSSISMNLVAHNITFSPFGGGKGKEGEERREKSFKEEKGRDQESDPFSKDEGFADEEIPF